MAVYRAELYLNEELVQFFSASRRTYLMFGYDSSGFYYQTSAINISSTFSDLKANGTKLEGSENTISVVDGNLTSYYSGIRYSVTYSVDTTFIWITTSGGTSSINNISIGSSTMTKAFLGNAEVVAMYLGDVLVYSASTQPSNVTFYVDASSVKGIYAILTFEVPSGSTFGDLATNSATDTTNSYKIMQYNNYIYIGTISATPGPTQYYISGSPQSSNAVTSIAIVSDGYTYGYTSGGAN